MRFLNYDYDGDGIETKRAALPLLSGIAIHAAHARLLAGEALDIVVTSIIAGYVEAIKERGLFGLDVTKELIREQSALLEGMLRVWAVIRMPAILAEYDIVSIEQTWDWSLVSGLAERMRMDVILRRKDDGMLFILDFKTVAYPSEIWEEKFEHDLQTCLYLQALRERYPDDIIGGILFEGLVKGQFKKETAKGSPWYGQKVQNSPYTVAYKLDGEQGMSVYQTEYTSKKGYHKVKTFDEMSMKDWVNYHLIPEGRANELFIALPAIMPPAYELVDAKEQVVREELEYHEKLARYVAMPDGYEKEQFLKIFAPKRTGRCFKYGIDNRCQFTGVCFNLNVEPLGEGSGFVKRTPHHDTDMEMVA